MSYFLTEYIEEKIETLFDENGVNYDDSKQSDDEEYDDDELYDYPPAQEDYMEQRESSAYPAYTIDPPIEEALSHSQYTEYLRDQMRENNGDIDYDDYEVLQNEYDPPEAIYDDDGNIEYY